MYMKSIFDLPESNEELSSTNQGMADVYYDQIQSLKGIGDTDGSGNSKFGTETYIYRWQMDSGSYWVPSRSYFKMRVKLSKSDGSQLDLNDNIAPMMGMASGLFNKIQYKILNRTISELTQFIPQVDAFRKRLNKSGQWLRDLGASSNFYQSCFQDRQKQVVSDGYDVESRYEPLSYGLFNVVKDADSITWTSIGNIITITNANDAGGNITTNLEVGDSIELTINDNRKVTQITAIAGFPIADNAVGTIVVSDNFGADQAILLWNIALPNFRQVKLRPKLFRSTVTQAQLFPNIEVGADQVSWTNATKTITYVDTNVVATATLDTIIKAGDYVSFEFNGLTQVARIVSVTGFNSTSAGGSFVVDVQYGVDSALANVTALLPNPVLYNEINCNKPRNIDEFELIWQPPISIFQIEHAIPGSQYQEIELDSANQYKKQVIQSLLTDKVPETATTANEYSLRILDMWFYLYRCKGPIVDNKTYMIDLPECKCSSLELTGNNTQLAFDIESSTESLALAFQTSKAGSNTLHPMSSLKLEDDDELSLSRYYIRYAGIQKPQPDADPDSFTANRDFIVQQYVQNQLYSGTFFDSSQETIEEWKERGVYFYHPWNKTSSDTSTRVYVLGQFNNNIAQNGKSPNMLLFNNFKRVAIIKMSNGRAVNVRVMDA